MDTEPSTAQQREAIAGGQDQLRLELWTRRREKRAHERMKKHLASGDSKVGSHGVKQWLNEAINRVNNVIEETQFRIEQIESAIAFNEEELATLPEEEDEPEKGDEE